MTGKEVRALGIKAVAALRAHGGLPALADWIEALDVAMDVSTSDDPKPPAPAPRFVPETGMQVQRGTPETDADPANPNVSQE